MGIIIKPIVTEKLTAITGKFPNRYGFRVSPAANKLEIRKAVEDMYQVTVVDVNTMKYNGKFMVSFVCQGGCARYRSAHTITSQFSIDGGGQFANLRIRLRVQYGDSIFP